MERILSIFIDYGKHSFYHACMIKAKFEKNRHLRCPAAQRELQQLGERIRINRKNRKWTLESLASRCGCSVPTLRDLEMGKDSVSLRTLIAVLWCLNKHKDLADVCEKPYVELMKDDPFKIMDDYVEE